MSVLQAAVTAVVLEAQVSREFVHGAFQWLGCALTLLAEREPRLVPGQLDHGMSEPLDPAQVVDLLFTLRCVHTPILHRTEHPQVPGRAHRHDRGARRAA
jgi:hypothetical protein